MKLAATSRLSLALGQPRRVALGLARSRVLRRRVLARAGYEAGQGNVVTATALLALYLMGF